MSCIAQRLREDAQYDPLTVKAEAEDRGCVESRIHEKFSPRP